MGTCRYFPNACEVPGTVYCVAQNAPNASDENPGTQERPFKTLSRAGAAAGMYDVVIIDEGTYREEVPLMGNGHAFIPESAILFKAVAGKQVYLKGSDIFVAEWQSFGNGTHKAALPPALFEEGAYNPYALSCVVQDPQRVRPAEGPVLPETLGQLYVDGASLAQLESVEAVEETPGSFVVSARGTEIVAHFIREEAPVDRLVELTVRERCFRPQFSGGVHIQTMGMQIEHAAAPGAFSYGRPLVLRKSPGTGITVRKRFVLPGSAHHCVALTNPHYRGVHGQTMVAQYPDQEAGNTDSLAFCTVQSTDGGKTWEEVAGREPEASLCFLDAQHDLLTRRYFGPDDPDGTARAGGRAMMFQVSADGGETWGEPERIGTGIIQYRTLKLADGTLLFPYTDQPDPERSPAGRLNVLIGKWQPDLSGVDWESGGSAEVDPRTSAVGLSESAACQLPDGRIFFLSRCSSVMATQDHPGGPSVKRFCVSEDGGQTLSEAMPLTYEDGRYVYSARSMPDVWRSSKNGRVYVIINIAPGPAHGADPRNALHIAELDPETLCVKRDRVAIVDARQEEHHPLVRFSNWTAIEDRDTGNLLLFMKLHMSEYCSIRKGYDHSIYRYEIELPG